MVQYFIALVESLMAREDEGQGMVEYGLILALVSVVAIALLMAVGGGIQGTLQTVSDALGGA